MRSPLTDTHRETIGTESPRVCEYCNRGRKVYTSGGGAPVPRRAHEESMEKPMETEEFLWRQKRAAGRMDWAEIKMLTPHRNSWLSRFSKTTYSSSSVSARHEPRQERDI
uniref:Uncharacterized protein n=1 Tax=Pristionchus pacificus TaxID=54126 RepID=A0A2A6B9F1_PRIPA|eukprot:PDM62497.1 hypothetical protein PRIPAC_51939 [Pristionchus pacificus]